LEQKKAILLVNLGTPDTYKVKDVRKYLREFLMDPRVIDVGVVLRWILVNLIIAPFRAPKSAKTYKKLWTDRGSPLKYHGIAIEQKLQQRLGDKYMVKLAMRYQNPSMATVMDQMRLAGVSEITIIPFFPQYASATTGSVYEEAMRIMAGWQTIPQVRFTNQFYNHPLFVKYYVEASKHLLATGQYDHLLFSYHGVPARHIKKGDYTGSTCQLGTCCNTIGPHNHLCYRAQCFATSRVLAQAMQLPDGFWSTAFQSRLGKDPWLEPYTEDVVKEYPKKGIKKMLVFSTAFVADCLETTIEIDEEYKELFMEHGGEKFNMLESFNDSDYFVDLLEDLAIK
jgi:protoporphyrin/coproporphyrin ferrochelatase